MHQTNPTRVLQTDTRERFDAAVAEAVRILQSGQLVALPTETVYGLAANALDPDAVGRIFTAKGRPAHNPIIVHVASLELARRCVSAWPESASALARAFWPGPLTLVLPKSPGLPGAVTAGGDTVGIRWPSHPFIQAVIRACGFPLAAPSANLSNRTSPTCAGHVLQSLAGRIPLVIDGGPCNVGIESTVVDLTAPTARVLRPGMVHEESLMAVLGGLQEGPEARGHTLRSPGLLDQHYAPKAKLRVLHWTTEAELRHQLAETPGSHHPLSTTCVLAHTRIPAATGFLRVSVIPHDPEAYARALYAELHRCDDAGATHIVAEAVPETPAWRGVADRLRRASSP